VEQKETMMMEEMTDVEAIQIILDKIQAYVYPRRVRVKELFKDVDPLRCGRCSITAFTRIADQFAATRLSQEEQQCIIDHFVESGPNVQKPQVFNYLAFCAAIDEVFDPANVAHQNNAPVGLSSPGHTMGMTFQRNSFADEEEEAAFSHALHRLSTLCKARGISLKEIYFDTDRNLSMSPSRQNPRRAGKCTKTQFIRSFPFKKEMKEHEIELICKRYNVSDKYDKDQGDIHFMAMHNDITEVITTAAPPFPTSPLYLKPDDTEWSHQKLNVIHKIQSKVVERRCRLEEFFKDFDALRKGTCTVGQVKSVFTIMDLSKYIDKSDFETLVNEYTRDDGMFVYKAFVSDVNLAFATPGLERNPLAMTTMPDATTTAPARRNRMMLTEEQMHLIAAVEDKVRTIVRKKGMHIVPIFTDFDPPRRGYVTRTQASRVLATLGFGLTDQEVGVLSSYYCDQGNHLDFNYKDFVKNVDPPPGDVMLAMTQSMQPALGHKPFPYFNSHGVVKPRMGKSPSGASMMLG